MSSTNLIHTKLSDQHNTVPTLSTAPSGVNFSPDPGVTQGATQARKRVRTGCFNCRRKHKKCDEQKPVCKACVQKNDACEWPDPNESTASKKAKRRKSSVNVNVNGSVTVANNNDHINVNSKKHRSDSSISISRASHSPSGLSEASISSKSSANTEENIKALNDYSKKLENMETSLSYNVNHSTTHDLQPSNNNNNPNNQKHWIVSPGALSDQSNLNHSPRDSLHMGNSTASALQEFERKSSISSRTDEPIQQVSNQQSQQPNVPAITSNLPFILSPSNTTQFDLLDLTDLQDTFRDYMFANASNVQENEQLTDLSLDAISFDKIGNTQKNSPSQDFNNHPEVLTKTQEKILLKNYLYKVAPWLDMFDLTRQMGLTSVQLTKKSPCLRYAILALSARQMEKTNPKPGMISSGLLYQTSLKYLIPTVKKKADIFAISACVMLCVFEMLSSVPGKWRYHLEGCSVLFKATGITGFSEPFERALFWAFARMDVNSAVIGEQGTMIESEKWIPEGVSVKNAKELFLRENSIDMYANYSVFLSSRVLNLISSTDISNFDEEWHFLWDEVREWHENRPEEMRPLMEFESSPFPEILYDNGPAISSNQLYHMSMIILMENKPRLYKIKSTHSKSPTWHAKQIVATSISNDHHGCWNNAVQNLYIAGKILTHEDEHRIILNLLDEIESTTGWAMKFRAKDLQEFWEQSC